MEEITLQLTDIIADLKNLIGANVCAVIVILCMGALFIFDLWRKNNGTGNH